MKRKHQPRKLTTSQLTEAGFPDLAEHLKQRFSVSIQGRPKFKHRKTVRREGRSFIDPHNQ